MANPTLSSMLLKDTVITQEEDPNITVEQIVKEDQGTAIAKIGTKTGKVTIYAPDVTQPGSTVSLSTYNTGSTVLAEIQINDNKPQQINSYCALHKVKINDLVNTMPKKLEVADISVTQCELGVNKTEIATIKVRDALSTIYAPSRTQIAVSAIVKEGEDLATIKVDGTKHYIKAPRIKTTYSLNDIYFPEDFTFSGNYTLGLKKTSYDEEYKVTAGTTLLQVFRELFNGKYKPAPAISSPKFTLKSCTSGTYNIGTTITPSYEIEFYPGQYEYGPDETNVTSHISVMCNGITKHDLTGTFNQLTIDATTNLNIDFIGSWTDGVNAYYSDYTISPYKINAETLDLSTIGQIKSTTVFYTSCRDESTKLTRDEDITLEVLESFDKSDEKPTTIYVPDETYQILIAAVRGTLTDGGKEPEMIKVYNEQSPNFTNLNKKKELTTEGGTTIDVFYVTPFSAGTESVNKWYNLEYKYPES